MNNKINIISITIFIFVIIIIILFLYSYSNNGTLTSSSDFSSYSSSSSSNNIGYIFLFSLFLLLVIINIYDYMIGVDIDVSKVENAPNSTKIDVDIYTNPNNNNSNKENENTSLESQVFNIPQNIYTYEDAKAVCSAFDSKLATYDQIENYYKKGGEFCNYGWSDNQLALFPTQKNSYNELSKIKGHEHDCGRAGINGGFISNPNVRFCANCYGKKPKMTMEEEELMATMPLYPLTKEDIEFEERVKYWKQKIQNIIISPFNNTRW